MLICLTCVIPCQERLGAPAGGARGRGAGAAEATDGGSLRARDRRPHKAGPRAGRAVADAPLRRDQQRARQEHAGYCSRQGQATGAAGEGQEHAGHCSRQG